MKKVASRIALLLPLLFALDAGAATLIYATDLSGLKESPPNASPGVGFASITYDTTAHTMLIDISFFDLLGTTTASHIHCCTAVPGVSTAGVATVTPTFTGFPLGVTSGTYHHLFDLSMDSAWNPAFLTANGGTAGAEALFASGLAAGTAYLNVHSSVVPGGEIRGFLSPVPEPASWGLLAAGLPLILLSRRRKQ
jgi:hypothetical protein